jgi:hypothetical protein
MNFHMPYYMNFHLVVSFLLVTCRLIWILKVRKNISKHNYGWRSSYSTSSPFRDVIMTKWLMWSNLDIHRRPLVYTTVVAIRLWVFYFSLQFNYLYFHHLIVSMWLKEVLILQNQDRCSVFQWIDEPEMFSPQIILFLYDQNEAFPYHSFKCWVPPSPNPPPMTDEEKEEATTWRVSHPPLCKCEYCS